MEPGTIALLSGILFLFIAVVGGGFSVERLQVPPVPRWSRIVAGVVGVGFIAGFLVSTLRAPQPDVGTAAIPVGPSPSPAASTPPRATGQVELFRFAGPERSPEGLELTGLVGVGARDPVAVGDVVRVRFNLRNVSGSTLTVTSFVAVRSPGGRHEDSAESVRVLPPGGTVTTSAPVGVDEEGPWSFWPCYDLDGTFCPDDWQLQVVPVGG